LFLSPLFPTTLSPAARNTCPATGCTSCENFDCQVDSDCCGTNYETCSLKTTSCYDFNALATPGSRDCSIKCTHGAHSSMLAVECAALNISDPLNIGCLQFSPLLCSASTKDGFCDSFRRRALRKGEIGISTHW
jgi:hypothetical protein